MNDVNTLNYNGNEIKYVKGDSGVTYICLKDICNILGLLNSNNVVKRVPVSDRKLIDVTYLIAHDSMNNPVYNTVPTMFLSQDGLDMFLNTSRKPEAQNLLSYMKYNSGIWIVGKDDMVPLVNNNDDSDIQDVLGVHYYTDKDNNIFMNIDDVSKGLGFVQTKNGKEYIRREYVLNVLSNILNKVGHVLRFPNVWECIHLGKLPKYIPEEMFYLLAMRANSQTAINFQIKVANEIIPMIRRTGVYMSEQVYNRLISDPTQLGEMMLDYGRVKKELEDNRYKMNSYDKFMDNKQSFSMATVAKSLIYTNPNKNNSIIGRNELFAILRDLNILQSGSDTWNMPYQEYVDQGYFQINIKEVNSKGNTVFIKQAKVLPKGIEFIINILNENGYSINNNDIPDEIN